MEVLSFFSLKHFHVSVAENCVLSLIVVKKATLKTKSVGKIPELHFSFPQMNILEAMAKSLQ